VRALVVVRKCLRGNKRQVFQLLCHNVGLCPGESKRSRSAAPLCGAGLKRSVRNRLLKAFGKPNFYD
jgi:hypothetical protein